MLGKGYQHRVRPTDLVKESLRLGRNAALGLTVDRIKRHLKIVEVQKFDLGARQHI